MRRCVTVEPYQKKWLSKAEAMKILGCGEDFPVTLRDKGGEVATSRYGRMIWHEVRSIGRFLKRNRVVRGAGS